MKKYISITVLLVCLLVSGLSIVVGAGEPPEPVTLKIMFFEEEPNHMDEVLKEFYRRTKDILNVKLDIKWSPLPDHKQKVLLAAAAGQEVDLVFDAPWMYLSKLASDGFYNDLEGYFFNNDYPGLKENFSENLLNNNRVLGKIYGIPLMHELDSLEYIGIRADLMKKYGFEEIKTTDKLVEFFDVILENEPDMVPLVTKGSIGFFRLFLPDCEPDNIFEIKDAEAGYIGKFYAALSDDYKEVLGIYLEGDPEDALEGFKAPWNKTGKWMNRYVKFREWNKYLEEDVLSQQDPSSVMLVGGAAAQVRGIDVSAKRWTELHGTDIGAQYVFPFRKGDRFRTPDSKYITYQSWNFLCVPVTSKHPDRVMKFVDWIFQSKENHDLFEFGIEGKHWVAIGEDKFKRSDDLEQPYVFPWYELTGTPNMIRYNADSDQVFIDLKKWASSEERNVASPLAGFSFDYSSVRTEKAAFDSIYKKIEVGIMNGAFEDPVAVLEKANQDARDAGVDKLKAEIKRQLQEFLNKKFQ